MGRYFLITVLLGYLAYHPEEEKAFIPNNEIMGEFENAISDGGWENVMKVIMDSERLLQNTLAGMEEEVAAALDRAHAEIASNLDYNTESRQQSYTSYIVQFMGHGREQGRIDVGDEESCEKVLGILRQRFPEVGTK